MGTALVGWFVAAGTAGGALASMNVEFEKATGMSPGGWLKTIQQVPSLRILQLAEDQNDLGRIASMLTRLEGSVNKSNLDD